VIDRGAFDIHGVSPMTKISPYLLGFLTILFAMDGLTAQKKDDDSNGENELSDPRLISSKALRARPPGDWKLKGVLTVFVGDTETSHDLNILYRFDDTTGLISRYEYINPEGKKQTIEVVYPFSGKPQVLDYDTGTTLKEPHKNLLNSSFTPSDLSLDFLSWRKQKFLGTEEFKDRSCYHIESISQKEDGSPYNRVEAWIDQKYFAIMKSSCYDAEGNIIKEFQIKSITIKEGNYIPKRIELNEPFKKRRTVLEIVEAKKIA
jgi:outer membrane lipoprotein-sorting protein